MSPLVHRPWSVIYDASCATCHGAHGEGAASTQLANPAFAKTATAFGNEGLAGSKLDKDSINDIIIYIRSLNEKKKPKAPIEQ